MNKNSASLKTTLIVEDDPSDVLLIHESLSECLSRPHLDTASNGEDALQYLNDKALRGEKLPDLIILDLNMPKMDGREFLKIVKSDKRFHDIPVVIFSTSELNSDINDCYKLSANCYVNKPVDLNSFKNAVTMFTEFWLGLVKLPERSHD